MKMTAFEGLAAQVVQNRTEIDHLKRVVKNISQELDMQMKLNNALTDAATDLALQKEVTKQLTKTVATVLEITKILEIKINWMIN